MTFRGRASGPTLIPSPSFLALESFPSTRFWAARSDRTELWFQAGCSPPQGNSLLSPSVLTSTWPGCPQQALTPSWPPQQQVSKRWSRLCKGLPGPGLLRRPPAPVSLLSIAARTPPPVRPRGGWGTRVNCVGVWFMFQPLPTLWSGKLPHLFGLPFPQQR